MKLDLYEKCSDFFDNGLRPFVGVNEEGIIGSWNPVAEKVFGWKKEEVVGLPFLEVIPPEEKDKGIYEAELKKAQQEQTSGIRSICKAMAINREGIAFPIQFLLHVVEVEENLLTYVSFLEEDSPHFGFSKEEGSFRSYVKEIKDFAILRLNPEGIILDWNEGVQSITGYTAKESIGKNFSLFFLEHEVEATKPQYLLKVAARKGRYQEEGWRVKKDGSLFWAHAVTTALYNRERVLQGYIKITRDLTDSIQTHQNLCMAKDCYCRLLNSITEQALFMLDPQGRVLLSNKGAHEMFGHTMKEIVGESISCLYGEEDVLSNKPQKDLEIAATKGYLEEEGWRINKEGSLFWVKIILNAMRNEEGNLIGFSQIIKDLSKGSVNEAADDSLLYETFLKNISTAIQTPIVKLKHQLQTGKFKMQSEKEPEALPALFDRVFDDCIRRLNYFAQLIEEFANNPRSRTPKS